MAQPGNSIGTLIKPHGFKGELLLRGEARFLKNLEPGIALFINKNGQWIPFFIEDLSISADERSCILKLEFINSDREARKYLNCQVRPDQQVDNVLEETSNIAILIGFTVFDKTSGKEFNVIDYLADENNPLLILEHKGQEVMLPANADYILSKDHKQKVIEAEFPEGLIMD